MFKDSVDLAPFCSAELARSLYDSTFAKSDSVYTLTAMALLYRRFSDFKLSYGDDPEIINTDPKTFSLYFLHKLSMDERDEYFENHGLTDKIKELDRHSQFISNNTHSTVKIYTIPDTNTVLVCCGTLSTPYRRLVISLIHSMFESIAKVEPLSQDEIEFMRTLTVNNKAAYVERLTSIVNRPDFKDFKLRFTLAGFERKIYEKKIKAAETAVKTAKIKMDEALEEYKRMNNERMDAMLTLSGLEERYDSIQEVTEVQQYIASNKLLSDIEIDDRMVHFNVKTFLAPYNFDEWDTSVRRSDTLFSYHVGRGPVKTLDDAKLLLSAIFSENHCLKVKMCAHFEMDFFGASVDTIASYPFNKMPGYEGYIPNPHLQYYRCFGENQLDILHALEETDMISAIEACINVARRICIFDPSYRHFVYDLYGSENKCIVTEDGTEMTVAEALTYLKEKKND